MIFSVPKKTSIHNYYKVDFVQNIKQLLGDEYEAFAEALENEPSVSIRINPWKAGNELLQRVGHFEKIPWCETGYYLPERPVFTFDPLFHAGAYYVQEASSMFLEQAILTILADNVSGNRPVTALDLCAAPGGKSSHLLSLLPENSLLVCNEVIRSRSLILAENIAKWGCPNTVITQSDPQQFGQIPHFFDVILADLPCSGEGMFRKDPTARNEWSGDHVKLCALRQQRIIRDVWNALKPGGSLIYSTCTFNTEENEDNIQTLAGELGADILHIPIKPEWNVSGALRYDIPVYRFFPHRTRGEGFFLALLRKNDAHQPTSYLTRRPSQPETKTSHRKERAAKLLSYLKNLLINPEIFVIRDNTSKSLNPRQSVSNQGIPAKAGMTTKNSTLRQSVSITAIPAQHESAYTTLAGCLNIISAGLPLGEWKGDDFIPSAALSLSAELNSKAFSNIELSYEQAIKYLQRESITPPANTPKGYLLVTFQNTPLGFIKNIGNRANNLYPPEWRIRKQVESFIELRVES